MVALSGPTEVKVDHNNCNTVHIDAPPQLYRCQFNINAGGVELNNQTVLIDPGADCNICAASLLTPSFVAKHKTPPSGVKGIDGEGKIIGQFWAHENPGQLNRS